MQQITTEILTQIKSIVGAAYVFTDEESFEKYGRDETEKLHYRPAVVVKPRKAEEIRLAKQEAKKPISESELRLNWAAKNREKAKL